MIILAPMASEYAIAKDRFGFMPNAEVIWSGIGPRNCLRTLLDSGVKKDAPIMLFGFAGSNFLPVGTEVFVTESYLHQLNACYDDRPVLLKKPQLRGVPERGVPCYSSSDFVVETKVIEPAVFDMELGFLTTFYSNVCSWRIVSDNLNLQDFNRFIEGENY